MAKVEYALEVLRGEATMPEEPRPHGLNKWEKKYWGSELKITDLEIFKHCLDEHLDNTRFDPSSHATASTYRAGCRGPMCTYARSRSRSDRTGGMNFLSNDLIEYITVLFWARSNSGQTRKIYDAPRNVLIFYSRLKAIGMTEEIDALLDSSFPFVGVPALPQEEDPDVTD